MKNRKRFNYTYTAEVKFRGNDYAISKQDMKRKILAQITDTEEIDVNPKTIKLIKITDEPGNQPLDEHINSV